MNSTRKNLAAAAWSKLESLSSLRKFLQKELEHTHQFSAALSGDSIVEALYSIDSFSKEISTFLQLANDEDNLADLEEAFEGLSTRYHALMNNMEKMIGQ
ncbi:MAG: hypothetical protein H6577_06835 [Lewinellaceae bacterium]|nr:hypothetical protein [Saprospiraceae bacterium]MCB9337825.1 hypothetical protein [Lewinellaceae bacterium]